MMELSNQSKLWFFQVMEPLSHDQMQYVKESLEDFLSSWKAHGAALFAGYEILHDRIVVVAVDEEKAMATGCSIDKLTHLFKEIGAQSGLDFFNRMIVHYEDNGQIQSTPLNQFWALRKANKIDDQTIVLDTTVKTLGEFKSGWKKPFSVSWHAEAWGR